LDKTDINAQVRIRQS